MPRGKSPAKPRRPLNMTAAKARPAGGQITVAAGWIEARVRPAFARAKYATPMTKSSAVFFTPRAPKAVRGSNLLCGNDVMPSPKRHSSAGQQRRGVAAGHRKAEHPMKVPRHWPCFAIPMARLAAERKLNVATYASLVDREAIREIDTETGNSPSYRDGTVCEASSGPSRSRSIAVGLDRQRGI
jgi:hypothetical protein